MQYNTMRNNFNEIDQSVPNFRIACQNQFDTKFNYSVDPCFWRSGNLYRISHSSVEFLAKQLNIQCHIDLRSNDEVKHYGEPRLLIDAGILWKNFPFSQENNTIRSSKFPNFYDYFEYYFQLIYSNQILIKEIIEYLLTAPYQRFIFSCYAGKDRTGIVVFLIMNLLNVKKGKILSDFHSSKEKLVNQIDFFEENWKMKNLTKEEYIKRFECDIRSVELLLSKIKLEFGTMSQFFIKNGISLSMQSQFKEKFYSYNKSACEI